jgi:hypothetical protein
MREDMAKVVVERPRIKAFKTRKGRAASFEDMPAHEGMRRSRVLLGDRKELNENLAPLRRYLEKQVGRPWNKIYAEIARYLRADSTIQQHVRDHIKDFVAVQPRRVSHGWWSRDLWWQPLYVDPGSGLLCRTDRLPEERVRRLARRNRCDPPIERVPLGKDAELRLLDGQWYWVQLQELPKAIYRIYREVQTRRRFPYSVRRDVYEIEVDVRRLITPDVWDVIEKRFVAVGPAIDSDRDWQDYRQAHPSATYAIAKRTLSRRELRRYGLSNGEAEMTPLAGRRARGARSLD